MTPPLHPLPPSLTPPLSSPPPLPKDTRLPLLIASSQHPPTTISHPTPSTPLTSGHEATSPHSLLSGRSQGISLSLWAHRGGVHVYDGRHPQYPQWCQRHPQHPHLPGINPASSKGTVSIGGGESAAPTGATIIPHPSSLVHLTHITSSSHPHITSSSHPHNHSLTYPLSCPRSV